MPKLFRLPPDIQVQQKTLEARPVPEALPEAQPSTKSGSPPAAPSQKLHVFPSDLGTGSYNRKTGTVGAADYYFINFGIVLPKKSTASANLSSSSSVVVDRRGEKITNWRGRDLNKGTDISPLLGNAYNMTTDTNIALYMPDELKVNYSADILSVDQGMLANYVSNGMMAGFQGSKDFMMANIANLFKAGLIAASGADEAASIFAQLQAREGEAVNPNTEQLFRNIKNREFNYNFKLVPRNANEGKIIQNIIKLFKYHMHPAVKADRVEFEFPSLFVITYYRSGQIYEELHKIGACYLENMNVDYAGAGQFHAFRDGQPVQVNLDLKFREAIIHTKESINQGY